MKSNSIRPRLSVSMTSFDYLLEFIALVGLFCLFYFTFNFYTYSPDIIPVHFDLEGNADRYGSKTELILILVISSLLYTGISVLQKYPHLYNYPFEIRENNALYQYTLAVRLLRVLKVVIIWIFFTILYTVRSGTDSFSGILIVMYVGVFLTVMISYFILASKHT
ncbi:MAG: DUF1648 domain-containing protein [Thermaurantimonas sp.]